MCTRMGTRAAFFHGINVGATNSDVLKNEDGDQCRRLLVWIDRPSRDASTCFSLRQ